MRGDRTLIIVWQVQTDVICRRDMKQKFPSPHPQSSAPQSVTGASLPAGLRGWIWTCSPGGPLTVSKGSSQLSCLRIHYRLTVQSIWSRRAPRAEWLLSWVLELNPDFPTCPVTLGSSFNFSLPPLPHLWSGYEWLCRLSEQIYINHMVE